MSYDVSLHATLDTGSAEPMDVCVADIGNYTSNVSRMWTAALGHPLADLHDQTAGDHTDRLKQAVIKLEASPGYFTELEPDNGWGDYGGALDYLRKLRDACILHPKATIRVSH
ncbi:hypothetical protein ACIQSP_16545 [Streptomyces nigra]|uniref:hypothetical protein n=1 Tax=Streptomyces nigra TaxID=1827580 RepID=UPI00382C00D8